MTPDDLAAIRARLADDDLCWHAITGDVEEPPTHHADRRALLAEVDRLGAEVARLIRFDTIAVFAEDWSDPEMDVYDEAEA